MLIITKSENSYTNLLVSRLEVFRTGLMANYITYGNLHVL